MVQKKIDVKQPDPETRITPDDKAVMLQLINDLERFEYGPRYETADALRRLVESIPEPTTEQVSTGTLGQISIDLLIVYEQVRVFAMAFYISGPDSEVMIILEESLPGLREAIRTMDQATFTIWCLEQVRAGVLVPGGDF